MTNIDTIINKKILLQTSNHPTPHLETELEIMERLLQNGNTIFWVICNGDFQTCFHNPNHNLMHCKVCHSRVNKGYEVLKKNVINHQNLHVLNYGQFLKLEQFKKNGFVSDFDFNTISELKSYHYKTYDSGMATASSLVSFTRNHEPDLLRHKDFINRGLLTGAYLYEVFQLILNQIQPDLVVLFNGRFVENRPLLRVCQEKNIDYASHERGGKLNTFLFRINSIPHSIETVRNEMNELWNKADDNRVAVGKRFYTNRIKRVEDALVFIYKRATGRTITRKFKNSDTKKVITIFNSSLDEYEGLEGFGPFFYKNDNEGILQICKSLENYPDVKLYLRVHPNLRKLNNSQNKFLKEKVSVLSSVEIIAAEDSVDTYALIDKSEIVIVFGSTVGAEAAFAGKKVVLLGRAAYENLECFVIPKSHEELIKIVTDDSYVFPTINQDDPLKYGYWNETYGINYQYYKPLNIGKGLYRGKSIKANFILRKLKRLTRFKKKK